MTSHTFGCYTCSDCRAVLLIGTREPRPPATPVPHWPELSELDQVEMTIGDQP